MANRFRRNLYEGIVKKLAVVGNRTICIEHAHRAWKILCRYIFRQLSYDGIQAGMGSERGRCRAGGYGGMRGLTCP